VALVGGGSPPRPGAISLAHHGVLFLDELPEFDRRTLDMLREPLETGHVAISRANRKVTFPARFQLIISIFSFLLLKQPAINVNIKINKTILFIFLLFSGYEFPLQLELTLQFYDSLFYL
jgi:hypothetical protein